MSDGQNKASALIEVDWGKGRAGRAYTADRRAVALLSNLFGDSVETLIAAAQQAAVPIEMIPRYPTPHTQVWAVWVEAGKHQKQDALVDVVAAMYPEWRSALMQLKTIL